MLYKKFQKIKIRRRKAEYKNMIQKREIIFYYARNIDDSIIIKNILVSLAIHSCVHRTGLRDTVKLFFNDILQRL